MIWAVVLFLWLSLIGLILHDAIRDPWNYAKSTDRDQRRTDEYEEGTISEEPVNVGRDAEEAAHRAAERRYWRHQANYNVVVGILTLGAAGAAIVAACIAFGAYSEAKRQADAAEKQIDVAKDSLQKQLRAYIVVKSATIAKDDSGKFKLGRTDSLGRRELFIYYEISNEGATPAYNVFRSVTIEYPFDGKISFDYTDGTAAYVVKQQQFGPIITRGFTDDERELIAKGVEKPLVFAGQITYRDIFDREWPTNFCFRYIKTPNDVKFEFCPRWTTTDKLNYSK